MGEITVLKTTPEAYRDAQLTTDDLLRELEKYGTIHAFQYKDKTWACKVDLSIKLPGFQSEVKAGGFDDNQKTLNSAALVCLGRLKKVIKEIRDNLPE